MSKIRIGLADALKIAREKKDMTQDELAAEFPVSQQTLGKWEASSYVPKERRNEVLQHYGVDILDYELVDMRKTSADNNVFTGDNSTNVGGKFVQSNDYSTNSLPLEVHMLVKTVMAQPNPEKIAMDLVWQITGKAK